MTYWDMWLIGTVGMWTFLQTNYEHSMTMAAKRATHCDILRLRL